MRQKSGDCSAPLCAFAVTTNEPNALQGNSTKAFGGILDATEAISIIKGSPLAVFAYLDKVTNNPILILLR